ncbi:MAG: hypothetical protein HQM08_20175 [Candidatus Riflebacteria bacterium]|nr:hypothetical protein [Candidatus Riflebacteria bacterium]
MPLGEKFDFKGFLTLIVLVTLFTLLNGLIVKDPEPFKTYFNSQNGLSEKKNSESREPQDNSNLNSVSPERLIQASNFNSHLVHLIVLERSIRSFSDWDELKRRIPEIKDSDISSLKLSGITIISKVASSQ